MLKKLIPRQSIPVELIQAKAYEIWATRERNKESGTSEDDWSNAVKFLNQHWWFVTLWKIDKRYQQLKVSATNSIKNAISFKTLSQAVNASVLIGAITFIAGEQQRRDAQVYQAWQVISAAHGQPGSGGRIQALEFLNSEPMRIPWFWLHWQRESLSGLEAPNAYLVPSRDTEKKGGIQLFQANLTGANLKGASLRGANLKEAYLTLVNLKGANLSGANLKEAYLIAANLQAVYLGGANLQAADLGGANLQAADLGGANLQAANLSGANLKGAYLIAANLQAASLNGANLKGAYLIAANLQAANLSDAKPQEAKYTDNSTSRETCKTYVENYPCPTTFPSNFDSKAAGMKLLK
ncbi:pentapeptide repeat-containing protein [Nostoc sp. C052]|uniref:pentapeptide repeat-containing protein n=1 Tax=Nostoc sp. C052 TaxID=2576902 RepID=UPI0015C37937|nr:pentapeptide repeat-containing protein [Nostoc sp. C052]QLE42247.1 pentapeptide repeat-containing protein [Nostoc sp. C052]